MGTAELYRLIKDDQESHRKVLEGQMQKQLALMRQERSRGSSVEPFNWLLSYCGVDTCRFVIELLEENFPGMIVCRRHEAEHKKPQTQCCLRG